MSKKHILHLVTKLPEKYNSKFVEFSENNLTEYEHTYVSLISTVSVNEERLLDSANIIKLNDLGRLKKMKKLIELFLSPKYDLVIFHGFFYTGLFLFCLALLFRFTSLAEKTLWMTWGGDIYYFQNRPESFPGFFNEFLRKSIIKRLFFISSMIPEELALIRVNYNTKAIELNAFYPNPTPYTECESIELIESKDAKFSFLLGNSADPQNNHINMLTSLKHLIGSVKIYCILSYSISDINYVEQVKSYGSELFGNDFIALTEFMKPNDYKELLHNIDFACYYHNRQQAMGNILQFLHMGKAVFVRQDILSSIFLQDLGLSVQDSEGMSAISVEKLAILKQESIKNKAFNQKIIEDNFSEIALKGKWQVMLKRVFSLLKKSH